MQPHSGGLPLTERHRRLRNSSLLGEALLKAEVPLAEDSSSPKSVASRHEDGCSNTRRDLAATPVPGGSERVRQGSETTLGVSH